MAAVVVTSRFGWRTVFGRRNFHRGLDLRSRYGDARVPIFSGTVTKVTRGRKPKAGVGRVSNGVPAHAPSLSGNAVTVLRADGGGYYVENHLAPAVEVGDRVTAGRGSLGRTDLSGSITAAHAHVELWRRDDCETYMDPTGQILAALADPQGWPTKATPPTRTPEEDEVTPDDIEKIAARVADHVWNRLLDTGPRELYAKQLLGYTHKDTREILAKVNRLVDRDTQP